MIKNIVVPLTFIYIGNGRFVKFREIECVSMVSYVDPTTNTTGMLTRITMSSGTVYETVTPIESVFGNIIDNTSLINMGKSLHSIKVDENDLFK